LGFKVLSAFRYMKWLNSAGNHADIFLAILVMTVVALLVLPIPTFLIDILICANISFALIVLLVAIYIPDSLKLSSFPTILLLTTLFRLGLNVATSRLILLNADAGQMVLAFGNTVVGGNLIVGIVIFLLLMLINMMVVAKGSERVAEVAARFTLDAMPGKQMSIDADLRSGILDLDQARKKREELNRESQLFGAMDGAMKFVKGDVIAGIIIFIINIVAGIIIGKFQLDMELDDALSTFAILSVGDGLVSIIPGLLMSVCAGLIVTRVDIAGDKLDLGSNVASQILAFPKAFFIAATFIALIGIVPGLPTIPLFVLSAMVFIIAFANQKKLNSIMTPATNKMASFDKEQSKIHATDKNEFKPTSLLPICIEVADNLIPFVNENSNFISELIPLLRENMELELGIDFPGIRIRPASIQELINSQYAILLNEVPVAQGIAEPNLCMVSAASYEVKALGIKNAIATKSPCTQMAASLVPIEHKETLEQAGFTVWDSPSCILLHLSQILRKNAKDFITIHETQIMLNRIENQFPALVKEVIPKAVSLFQLTDILKRLLSEEISIKDIKTILQTLAEFGPVEQNTIMLTEHVRVALSRYLCFRFGHGQDTLLVYLLTPDIEDMIRSSIVNQHSGSYLALEPDLAQDILNAIRHELNQLPPNASQPVLLTNQEIRRFVRKLIEVEFHEVAVMSYQELSSDFKVQPIGRIGLQSENEIQESKDFFYESQDNSFTPTVAMP
jgi:type III secretion protein V